VRTTKGASASATGRWFEVSASRSAPSSVAATLRRKPASVPTRAMTASRRAVSTPISWLSFSKSSSLSLMTPFWDMGVRAVES
jgi:hypothetical protein